MTDINKRAHNVEELLRLVIENFEKEDYALHPTYSNAVLPLDEETVLRDRRNFINRIEELNKRTYTDEKLSAEFETAVHEKAKRFAFCKDEYSFKELLKMRDEFSKEVKFLRKTSILFPEYITFSVKTSLLALDFAIDYRKKSILKSADL